MGLRDDEVSDKVMDEVWAKHPAQGCYLFFARRVRTYLVCDWS
jgi:hypothetical protein